ncbi:receptor-like protein 12 [Pyrus ussuriensis x Pyrus communis]|uniref:Receptor-like protein 12 n=1 Tax=Pyrus ussuriensis x Pyrus communis TaxID=2448454 RepID=A0A5N5HXR0_9ROSA|nr:receptor-like protein 12 [Pyrus ussuriensis x Pyrus communis]
MDSYCHLSIAHYLLLLLLVSFCMHNTTKLRSCLAGDEISSSVKRNSYTEEERQALLAFVLEGHDCSQWEGISCNNSIGHVVEMDHRNDEGWINDSLRGKINASLLSLKHLNYLGLEKNPKNPKPNRKNPDPKPKFPKFSNWFDSNQIPKFIGELKSLQYLTLSFAYFGGEIPPCLGNLSSLNFLDLESNQDLSSKKFELAFSMAMFKSLQNLNLKENNLWGTIPDSIRNLSYLRTLDLSYNKMNGTIPESIGQLYELVSLFLFGNSWEGILTEAHFINLTKLQDFGVGSINRSMSLIFNVAYHSVPPFKLHTIQIINCGIKPGFWVWLQTQTEISDVFLRGNGISDFIPEEWLLKISSQLTHLDLSYNRFRGNFPCHLKFPNLTFIDLSHNQLEGPLPLWCFPNVDSLFLESNFFSGPIHSNIDRMMPKLQELLLDENHLNGTIPPSICNIHKLQILSLRSNQFSGELPHAWNMESNMVFLDVGQKIMSSKIPTSLGVLSSLEILKLNNNNFGGEIRDALQNCSNLRSIYLGDNKLSGKMPLWIGRSNVPMLSVLRLRSNYFSGHISQQLCNLDGLHILDLSNNSISGTIPMCLDNLTSLVNDDYCGAKNNHNVTRGFLHSNNIFEHAKLTLKGEELVYNTTLYLVKIIDLSSNNLQGEIPEEISNLILLGTLNLSMNQLSGKIPSKIPQSLSSLTFLAHLDLSYNIFFGRIPSGNQLQTLNVSSIYMGNPWLCGIPLSTKCPKDDTSTVKDAKDKNEEGNDKLYAYFQFFDDIKDKIALVITLKVTSFKRFLS